MAFIRLPEKQKPCEVLEGLKPLVEELQVSVSGREHVLKEVRSMSSEITAAEKQLGSDQKELYRLLLDKLRQEEIVGADDYCSSFNAELERLERERQKKAEAEKGQ